MVLNCTKESIQIAIYTFEVILNLSPDLRYKKKYVIPGGIIPGPNNPEDLDSFVFPGMHHAAALHNEGGLKIWKASTNEVVKSDPFLAKETSDFAAMPKINGLAGHYGSIWVQGEL